MQQIIEYLQAFNLVSVTLRLLLAGLAGGSGYYEIGILLTLFILLTESLLDKLSARIKKSPEFNVEMILEKAQDTEGIVSAAEL